MRTVSKRFLIIAALLLGLSLLAVGGAVGFYLYLRAQVPPIEAIKHVDLQVPLRVYTRDGKLIAEYGEVKRTPLTLATIPPLMTQAVLAAEDDRYFQHPGVDYQGLLRAVWMLLTTGEKTQGGSTITMQVARDFFLTKEKTYKRKLIEIMLALKMDQELSKQEILELYLNMPFLGNRAYGVAAAAQVYYGTDLAHLTLPQMAMIAGLYKGPSVLNPIVNPTRALERRNYVLRRMDQLHYIDKATHDLALATPDNARLHGFSREVEAPYVAEMVRAVAVQKYGEDVYNNGYKVYSTIDSRLQRVANGALRNALLAYDMRHGYRGPEAHSELPPRSTEAQWRTALAKYSVIGELWPALVIEADAQTVHAYLPDGQRIVVTATGLAWAHNYHNPKVANTGATRPLFAVGDIIRVQPVVGRDPQKSDWRLAELPAVAGSFVVLDPNNGTIIALVGGFDFFQSKFNRAIQAERQPGSSFKPFVYSAALEKGYTPATVVNDAPLALASGDQVWHPENFSGDYAGPTRLRDALTHSRNTVSVRVLQDIGVGYLLDYATRFGFPVARWDRNLTLALGTGSVTPLTLATAYATFANGGYKVDSNFIDHTEDATGKLVARETPTKVCPNCGDVATPGAAPRVISAQNAYLMTSLMQDVIRRGTARRATALGRNDIAGKTGTTNEQRDAWFAGFNSDYVAVSWVGFDTPTPLGGQETGGFAALPMWMDFMGQALKGRPEHTLEQPPGLVTVRINPETGQLAPPDDATAIFEIFPEAAVPSGGPGPAGTEHPGGASTIPEQMF